jgi:Cu-Zn family superoxide dismutase
MRKLILLAPLLATACMTTEPQGPAPLPLINALGAPIGTVRAVQTPAGISFRIDASGLPPGVHGIHVHAVGRCDPPDFTSAGGHWNPASRQHGFENPAGHHAGDLMNVTVAPNGVLHTNVTLANGPDGAPAALNDADGAALVIHAAPDDYRTDPSGNSGARIACAIIAPPVPVR